MKNFAITYPIISVRPFFTDPFFDRGPWGGIINLLIIILVIALIVELVSWLFSDRSSPPLEGDDYDHSLEILKERYARGEIDRNEFEERKRTLMHAR